MMIPSSWHHQLRNEELGQRILIYSIDCLIELPGIVESLKTRVCEGANSQSEEYVISITPLINSPAGIGNWDAVQLLCEECLGVPDSGDEATHGNEM